MLEKIGGAIVAFCLFLIVILFASFFMEISCSNEGEKLKGNQLIEYYECGTYKDNSCFCLEKAKLME